MNFGTDGYGIHSNCEHPFDQGTNVSQREYKKHMEKLRENQQIWNGGVLRAAEKNQDLNRQR